MFNQSRFNRFRFNRANSYVVLVSATVHVPVLSYRMILAAPESIPFFLVLSSDHKTPAIGLTPAPLISSAGAPFRSSVGTVSEIGQGWYGVVPTAQDILGMAPLLIVVPPPVVGVDHATVRVEIAPISGVAPLRVGISRYPLTFYMTLLDHVTPGIGLGPSVLIRKSGQEFQVPDGTVSEIGQGWYQCQPSQLDVDTVGPLVLEATAIGADPTFEVYDVTGSVLSSEIDRYTLTLLMIRTMLINSGMFTEGTCVISLDRMPFSSPSIPSAWITPGATGFDGELESGGTRYTLMTSPTFTINILVRRMQDSMSHDKNWITDSSKGAYPLVWRVINLLAGKFVYSSAGDLLTTRNLHPVQIGNPYRYNQDSMLAVVPVTFTTNVQIDVDLSHPYIQ